jgi:hypothetical protein
MNCFPTRHWRGKSAERLGFRGEATQVSECEGKDQSAKEV